MLSKKSKTLTAKNAKGLHKELFCLIDYDSAFFPIENIRIIEVAIVNLKDVKYRINEIKTINN